MAIIVEENGQKVYKSLGFMTLADKIRADELDNVLSKKMEIIEKRLEDKGLLNLKGKPGVIKLWYSFGFELRNLWTEVKLNYCLQDTLLKFFIKAAYDHSNKTKVSLGSVSALKNSYFYYCFLIAELPWNFVGNSGNWREWVEFFDSKRIRDDKRIIEWFANRQIRKLKKKKITKGRWFRSITRKIRRELRNIDTRVLEKTELFQKLDEIIDTID